MKSTPFLLSLIILVSFAATTPRAALAQDAARPKAPAATPDEKIAPDIDAKAMWDGRKVVPFRALDFPTMVKASEADFLGDSEYVLGVTLNGESRAYPTRFVWFHHVINDKIGEPDDKAAQFAVFYCSVCNAGVLLDRTVSDKPIMLDFYGLYNGIAILCDRDTQSVLVPVEGRMVKGPLTGTTMKAEPLLDTTWKRWKQLHPDTLVMSPETPFKRAYRTSSYAEPRGYESFPAPYFGPSVTRHDTRLPAFDKVLAVAAPSGKAAPADSGGVISAPDMLFRAYPIKTLQQRDGVINDSIGGLPVVALCELDTVTASAFSRKLDGRTLTFEARKAADGSSGFFDKTTGSRWNIEGLAEEGAMKGRRLDRLQNHLSQWYGWVASFPQTTIYGRNDAPHSEPGFPPPDAPGAGGATSAPANPPK